MNKSDLISRVSMDANLSRRDATSAVESLLNAIQGAVARGDRVSIPGFGTFERRNRAARTARNPQTGETIKVKASKVPAFKAGQGFKDTVSGTKKSAGGKAAPKKAAKPKAKAKAKR
ncbi:MAG TPA: HU family DNA-binding protein [Actinomycetota bacterium]|nr:HU family DNA-binding protein [Actinomycetota bacterium]